LVEGGNCTEMLPGIKTLIPISDVFLLAQRSSSLRTKL